MADIDPYDIAIIGAAYHAGRKVWPQWLAGELARRVGRGDILADLQRLHWAGLMGCLPVTKQSGANTWYATAKGRRVFAAAGLRAEPALRAAPKVVKRGRA